jgi:ADP-heptose:LPS heptosyltransferase
MKILLISRVDESQLYILNVLTNTLFLYFEDKVPSISLFLISETKVDDNVLFIEKKYSEVEYINRFNQLKIIKKKEYDYLISIENSLLGLAISTKVNAKLKVSFKRTFGFLVFDNLISQKKKNKN